MKDRDDMPSGLTYREAGVDVEEGNSFVEETLAPLARQTSEDAPFSPRAVYTLGGFGAAFDTKAAGFDDPILVMACDGVGTKLRLAIQAQSCGSVGVDVGIDLVAMCANDLLSQGAQPLAFLDYFAYASIAPRLQKQVMESIAEGCAQAGCALVGGETAQMPGFYRKGDFDLAGFMLGAVERDAPFRKARVEEGDRLFAVPSSGVHANGFSLVREVLKRDPALKKDKDFIQALLKPTRIYSKVCAPWIEQGLVSGIAHITGRGIEDNLPRILQGGQRAEVDMRAIARPEVFVRLQQAGNIAEEEMRRVFNCGAGLVVAVPPSKCDDFMRAALSEKVVEVGVVRDTGDASAKPFVMFKTKKNARTKHNIAVLDPNAKPFVMFKTRENARTKHNIAVLISGRGSNLEALIRAAKKPAFPFSIALVVADREAEGCLIAEKADIPYKVVDYEELGQSEFEQAIDRILSKRDVEFVCLAGFMRMLSPWFVGRWWHRITNIHPSLLPLLRGLDTHRRALAEGHLQHGCSVHIVTEELDAGEVLGQEKLDIEEGDSPESLAKRVLKLEHQLYSEVLAEHAVRLLEEDLAKCVYCKKNLRMDLDEYYNDINGLVCFDCATPEPDYKDIQEWMGQAA